LIILDHALGLPVLRALSPAGEWIRSFAVVTCPPNELCAELHNRMPVVLGPETWPAWLGEEPADPRQLQAMLAPYPSEEMTCWPVSTRVGNVKNNDPQPGRTDCRAMNLQGWLAALFVMLALAGCAQMATEQGQAPNALYPPEFDRHIHGGVDM
jgi:hypothetical protein